MDRLIGRVCFLLNLTLASGLALEGSAVRSPAIECSNQHSQAALSPAHPEAWVAAAFSEAEAAHGIMFWQGPLWSAKP